MKLIFISLLLILINNEQVTAQLPISFTDIKTAIEWGMKVYETVDQYRNPDKTRANVEEILRRVEELSSKLDSLETRMDVKLDTMLNTLLNDFETKINLVIPKSKLSDYIDLVHHIYINSKKYSFRGVYCAETLEKFSDSILWGRDSLPNTLTYIRDLFIPGIHRDISSGFLSLTIKHDSQNLPIDCDKFASSQQRMYYIYTQLIMAEMKGLAAIKQIYTTKWLINTNSYNYAAELNDSVISYKQRLEEYYKVFKQDIGLLPRHIRRCHAYSPKIGVDYLELRNFSRIMLFDKNYNVNDACEFCLKNNKLGAISRLTNTTIYNCTVLGIYGTFCLADRNSSREYMWWKDKQGVLYGHDAPCASTKVLQGSKIVRGGATVYTASNHICNLCMCSVDQNKTIDDDKSTVWRISVTAQVSDLWNDMVVTGVRFVLHDNALHLQIQQTKFSHSGMIYSHNEWKELEVRYESRRIRKKGKFQYEPLRKDRKMLLLDDTTIPGKKVITGVRFKLVEDCAFMLQIHATPYDFTSGKLDLSSSRWYDASKQPTNHESYKRERIEINMGNADDPTRGSDFKYDLESNKFIEFTHTDIHKDGGQTTIPLIDAQPAITQPPFPLNGIGLVFRGEEGFGGFIAAQIRTIFIPQYMIIDDENSRSHQVCSAVRQTSSDLYSSMNQSLAREGEDSDESLIESDLISLDRLSRTCNYLKTNKIEF